MLYLCWHIFILVTICNNFKILKYICNHQSISRSTRLPLQFAHGVGPRSRWNSQSTHVLPQCFMWDKFRPSFSRGLEPGGFHSSTVGLQLPSDQWRPYSTAGSAPKPSQQTQGPTWAQHVTVPLCLKEVAAAHQLRHVVEGQNAKHHDQNGVKNA